MLTLSFLAKRATAGAMALPMATALARATGIVNESYNQEPWPVLCLEPCLFMDLFAD